MAKLIKVSNNTPKKDLIQKYNNLAELQSDYKKVALGTTIQTLSESTKADGLGTTYILEATKQPGGVQVGAYFANPKVLSSDTTIPVGTVLFTPVGIVPIGFVKGNGVALNRLTYPRLFDLYGTTFGAGDGVNTFNIIDLRGYFPRFWDDGRGIDTGRVLGSIQDSQNKLHNHTVNTAVSQSGGSYPTASGGMYGFGLGASTQNDGGAEARPKNISLMAIIKY